MSILIEILESVRDALPARKRAVPESEMRRAAEVAAPSPSFRAALARPGTSLIAEAKRRSPSKGELRSPYDPSELARTYESAGARAVSVLTEPRYFGGDPEHLRAARRACTLPLLRKDFLVDPYQCWEAKAWGASAALLIVAALDDDQLRDLVTLLGEIGLDALVEVHTETEAERALAAGAPVVGVNNRDLATFETDLGTTARIAALLPPETLLVAESGIFTRTDVLEVEAAGAEAILVGGAILTSGDPARVIRDLIEDGGGKS